MKYTKFAGILFMAMAVSPAVIVSAVEDGLGTNVVRNIRVQTTGVIDLGGSPITNWNDVSGYGSNIASWASNTAYYGSNTANWASNAAYYGSNTANWASNAAYYGSNTANWASNAVNVLNASTTRWDNAAVIKEGDGSLLTYSNLYYYAPDKKWYKANATNSATASGLLGLAIGGAGSIANNGLLLNGQCTNLWGFADGAILYMDTNAGALATTMPTGTNNIVRIVGYAISATNIYFNPDRTYIQIMGQ